MISSLTPYQAMQAAVDIVNDSEHSSNKIAACLFHKDDHVVRHNHRPDGFKAIFRPDEKIGGSSQFLHAEVACIFAAPFAAEGAQLCVTDPFCPNCAKAIAESGISHVYIDHKGMEKDFAKRRGDDFESLSLLMMERAGIAVSIIYRREQRIEPLVTPPVVTRRGAAKGIEFFDWGDGLGLADYLHKFRTRQPHGIWALARVTETNGHDTGVIVFEDFTQGITPQDYKDIFVEGMKYRLPVDPLNRLLFFVARKGMTLNEAEIACNLHPSSRALVNAVGYGIQAVYIGEQTPDHDSAGSAAAEALQKNGILTIKAIS